MPGEIPTREQLNKAKQECDNARQAVKDKWYSLSAAQQQKMKDEEGFDFLYQMGVIDETVPAEITLDDVCLSYVNNAMINYSRLLDDINDSVRMM